MKKYLRISAFSLLELSVVLVIVGVLISGVLKGKSILDNTKIQSIATDFQKFKIMIDQYKDHYLALPGDDPNASNHFSNVISGDGDGTIGENDAKLFWSHLYKAGSISSELAPTSKIGGYYNVTYNPKVGFDGHWIVLGIGVDSKKGLLTPKQAKFLKSKIEDGSPTQGDIRFLEGFGIEEGKCVQGNNFNLSETGQTCVAYMKFD